MWWPWHRLCASFLPLVGVTEAVRCSDLPSVAKNSVDKLRLELSGFGARSLALLLGIEILQAVILGGCRLGYERETLTHNQQRVSPDPRVSINKELKLKLLT